MLLALGALAAPLAEAQTNDLPRAIIRSVTGDASSEGTTLVLTLWLIEHDSNNQTPAPAGGLTVNVTVTDTTVAGADFLAPATEGTHKVTFRQGASTATLSIPTVDDDQDEPNGQILYAVAAGNGYTVGPAISSSANILDNDTPVRNLTVNPVSGKGDKLNVSWDAPTGVTFVGYSVKWKTRSQTYLRGSRTGSASFLASTTSYQITGLTPGTEYDVLVNALSASLSAVAGSATSATTHSNRAPAFLEQYYFFELAENNDGSATPVSLGTVSATDPDGGTVRYFITDGDTSGKFAISPAGAITYTGSGENYEGFRRNRAGFGTPDMAYVLTVEASDAGGASGAATVTIQVTDVDDPPAAPAAPTVSPTQYSTTSLDVNWERPANGGPPITGYDLRYRAGNSGSFMDGPQDVTVPVTFTRMSARITGLTAGTAYQVQVRASNEEGDGPWSNSGTGTTTPTPPNRVDGVTGINLTLNKNSIDEGGQAQLIRATVSLIGQTRSTATSVTIDGEGITTDDDILAWDIHRTHTIPANTRSVRFNLGITPRDDSYHEGPETFRIIAAAAVGGYELIDKEVVTIVDNDAAAAPPTDSETPTGIGAATLTGLTVSPVSGEPTKLAVSWEAVQDAARYDVRWKTGAGDYGDPVQASTNSHTVTDLSAGTAYTVNVAALDADNSLLAEGTASGTTASATGTGQAQFTVYHDPRPSDASAAAGNRYDSGVALLDAASRTYAVRTVSGAGEVDQLAGVENSVLPRFFLGDPTEEGWGPSEPGVNNGGLKWLRKVLQEQQESSPPPAPTVTVAAGTAVDEGTAAAFTVTLSQAAPADGLTLAYTVSEDGAFVAASDEGAKTLSLAGGATSATLSVATVDDDGDEADGKVTVTLDAGTGYEVGDPASASVTVRDDDEPVAAPAAFTVYHDPSDAAAVTRYQTAVGLLKAASRSYAVRTVSGTAKVDDLAGVSGSVMPRFFLGDPEEQGWGPAQAKVNNGGLKWLRSELGQTQAASAPALAAPAVSVADARVREETTGAVLAFAVTLDKAAAGAVTVDYATSDGTATAGADYTATSGTLAFAAGETAKTVSVPVLDDAHDEGEETLTLTLSNAVGARIADGEATGTIENTDPLQREWLARFGRTVAGQMIEALEGRFAMDPGTPSHLTIAGRRLDFAGAAPLPQHDRWRDEAWRGEETHAMALRELLLGSSFHFTTGAVSGLGAMTGWGKALSGSSHSAPGGGLSLTSETVTGVLGMDWERDKVLVGVALSESVESGSAGFAPSGAEYDLEGALSLVTPYARIRANDRLSVWTMMGSGEGSLSLAQGDASQSADIALQVVAAGGRAELLRPEGEGFSLALKTDAYLVRTESAGVSAPGIGNLAGATGDASRVRAVLEGSRAFALSGGGSVEPSLSLGLRHDGGDAETGTGVEFGAGLAWSDPSRGLTSNLRLYGLAAHEAGGYDEWGVSGSLRIAPAASGRGLSLSMTPSWGAEGQSGRLWDTRPSALAGDGGEAPGARLDAELGYGLPLSGGLTGTPYVGLGLGEARDYRLGWRLASGRWQSFSLGVEAARREAANDDGPENRIGLDARFRW